MRVLIACEFSGIVRRAFARHGHLAVSCDLLPTEIPLNGFKEQHYQGDILELLKMDSGWDLMIAHPPCTYLASSGARWWSERKAQQLQAVQFVSSLADAGITRIAIENPIGILSTIWRKPDQIIQPWMFGHGETKATCLWLKGLPKLVPTNIVTGRQERIHRISALRGPGSSTTRQQDRSRTYQGIADAMAEQWGRLPVTGRA